MRRIARIAAGAGAALAVLAALAFAGASFFLAQRADYGWSPPPAPPTFTAEPPRVLFDEGHHNASTIGLAGRYWPFGQLLRADGYRVTRGRGAFSAGSLAGAQVLIVANAAGAARPQVFGINLTSGGDGRRADPAFTPAEVELLRSWVEAGGSLLLVADHAPFGRAAAPLAAAFGVTMHAGFLEVPGEVSDPLLFTDQNGRLGAHPILAGDGEATRVSRVMTYTGQSLDGPPGATVLLRLPANAVEAVPAGETLIERPGGPAQGLAMEVGRGRLVVLGEAALLTAQVAGRVPYGMNTGDNDNRQFALNLMHWLSRRL